LIHSKQRQADKNVTNEDDRSEICKKIYKRCKLKRAKWQDWESRTGSILGNKAP